MNETTSSSAPALSVVVAANRPWPAVRDCLDRLCAQSSEWIIEIILADSSDKALPADFQRTYGRVRWLKFAGNSVFSLRARGASAALGKVVAVTEDHCIVGQDWCERLINSHDKNLDKLLISGPVVNGSIANSVEWANFLLTLGPFLPPVVETGISHRAPPISNLSFKRKVFPERELLSGEMEFSLVPRLLREKKVFYDADLIVAHVQSHGLWETCMLHFHNGRSTMGLNSEKRIMKQFARVQAPQAIVGASIKALNSKPEIGEILQKSQWLMFLMACFHTVGELTAILLRGPGRSPDLLE